MAASIGSFKKGLKYTLLLFWFLWSCQNLCAQKRTNGSIVRLPQDTRINIDGVANEAVWKNSDILSDFLMSFPDDQEPSSLRTEVRMLYDDTMLYITALCFKQNNDYVVTSLKRDFDFEENDSFILTVSPYDDRTNGFFFAVTPFNSQAEGLISFGDELSLAWDNKWHSGTRRYDDRWELEMAIPLSTLRFSNNEEWEFNFGRNERVANELSAFSRVPLNFKLYSLAFVTPFQFATGVDSSGSTLSAIPYFSVANFENTPPNSSGSELELGMDLKWTVTPSLNLDMTFNPDFSQVEVDQQVINLQRFELFFPERRQFFLENADVFDSFGTDDSRPFFSRRIGLITDPRQAVNVEVPIVAGARLSGRLNRNWRLGLMNIQTIEDKALALPSSNYTVAAVQRSIFERSNVSLLLTNKGDFGPFRNDSTRFSRLAGIEYNFASPDNRWTGKVFYHRTSNPFVEGNNQFHGGVANYSVKKFSALLRYQYIGEHFNTQLGFVPRVGYRSLESRVDYRFFSKSKELIFHGPTVRTAWIWGSDTNAQDRNLRLDYNFSFSNNTTLRLVLSNFFVRLFAPFDPSNTGGEELSTGSSHDYTRYAVQFFGDRRKPFFYNVLLFHGGFFNGERLSANTEVYYRVQPYFNLGITFTYESLDFPSPFSDNDFILLGPSFTFSPRNDLFFSSFFQYNEQIDNANLNLRLQWRFQPASDLFIVYTENYLPDGFVSKNRGVVLKLNYWLNF